MQTLKGIFLIRRCEHITREEAKSYQALKCCETEVFFGYIILRKCKQRAI